MLTPVSFAKPRESAPRLSPARVPGRHSERFWTEQELTIVRDNYVERGARWCAARLPNRSIRTVYNKATGLGLRSAVMPMQCRRIGDRFDQVIRDRWPEMSARGAMARLAEELDIPRHAISKRASLLGLSMPHAKEPPWSEAEEALLRQVSLVDPARASKVFASYGFARTPNALVVHAKRAGVSLRPAGVLSATEAARIIGVHSKTIALWCVDGSLPATKRGTRRLPQQGGDTWSIRHADFRQFVIDTIDRLDIRKVDKHAFVALLIAPAAAEGQPR